MKISGNKSVNVNGFSLACYLPGITMQQVFNAFPEARVEGYFDDEKGYTEDEALFSTSDGDQFYVYSR